MPRQFRPRKDLNLDRMFETRSDAWEKVGLSFEVNQKEVKRAQRQAIFFVIAIIAVFVATHILLNKTHDEHGLHHRPELQAGLAALTTWGVGDLETVVRIAAVTRWCCGSAGGWRGRSAASSVPTFMRRMDPATAGTFGFVLRLATMADRDPRWRWASPGWTSGRWRSAVRSPRSSSVSLPSRRWAT